LAKILEKHTVDGRIIFFRISHSAAEQFLQVVHPADGAQKFIM